MSLTNLANALSALGQYQPALAAVEEAVTIFRELAAQRPDTFQPNLAVSLAVRANCLDVLNPADALATDLEAIKTLSSAFVQRPAAFGHWMGSMVQQYRERCERVGQTPNTELLGPILVALGEQRAFRQPRAPLGFGDTAWF